MDLPRIVGLSTMKRSLHVRAPCPLRYRNVGGGPKLTPGETNVVLPPHNLPGENEGKLKLESRRSAVRHGMFRFNHHAH